ncbi:MAG TPA: glycosyltransferase [Marmoricola sp.]
MKPMRLVVEAMAADFGGIRTYVEWLLRTWGTAFPDDDLLVVTRADSDLDTAEHRRRAITVPRPAALGRPLTQSLLTPGIVRDFGADAVLATLPSTGFRHPGVPLAVVVHDLRHDIQPEQFSRSRRLLRRVSYRRTYALADGFIAVSQRTLDDLTRLYPDTATRPSIVVHHGADHALEWHGRPGSGPAVTFAHHTNKNPDLVIDAWAIAQSRGVRLPHLMVVGAGAQRDRLAARIRDKDLADRVSVAGYLPNAEFNALMGSASMIVFPSDFEGFGMPVLEGMLRRVPVVAGPDPAVLEVSGGHAFVMTEWTAAALADAAGRAVACTPARLDAAHAHAREFTWTRATTQTRAFLAHLSTTGREARTT